MKNLILILACWLLLAASAQAATTRYMATAGDSGRDSNTCAQSTSISTPKLTFASAIPCMASGDTLEVRAGTFTAPLNTNQPPSGSSWAVVTTIKNYNGEAATILGTIGIAHSSVGARSYIVIEGFTIDGNNTSADQIVWIGNGSHHIRFLNNTITNGQHHGIISSNVQSEIGYNEFIGNTVHTGGGTLLYGSPVKYNNAIYLGTPNNLVQGNIIYGWAGAAIQIYTGDSHVTDGTRVIGNWIHDTSGAIGTATDNTECGQGIIAYDGAGITIYNNIISNLHGDLGATCGAAVLVGGGSTGTVVVNNTMTANRETSVRTEAGTSNAIIKNNISWLNCTSGCGYTRDIADAGTSSTKATNLCDTAQTGCSVVATDPLFTSAPTDLTLQAGSDAIDAGTCLGAPFDLDYTGFQRAACPSAAWDIGAYERHTAAATWTANFTSTNPTTGVAVTITPNGTGGDCSGVTPIACVFNDGEFVTATWENPSGSQVLSSITGCDPGQFPEVCTMTVSSDRTMTANYTDPPTGDVMAWWKMDEGGSTNIADSAGSNTGTLSGSYAWSTYRNANVVLFDGGTSDVLVAASATLSFTVTNAFTIVASVLPSATSNNGVIIINNTGGTSYALYSSLTGYCSGNLPFGNFFHSAIETDVCGKNPLSTTVATRLGVTYDGTDFKLYRNGVLETTVYVGAIVDTGVAGTVQIGESQYGENYTGKAWNIKLSNRAWTPTEMAADAPSRTSSGGGIAFGGKIGM